MSLFKKYWGKSHIIMLT